jgi:hypothetical protein
MKEKDLPPEPAVLAYGSSAFNEIVPVLFAVASSTDQ